MRLLPAALLFTLTGVVLGQAGAVAEGGAAERMRKQMCLEKQPFHHKAGDPSSLSPFARSVFEASKLSKNQFASIAGGAADPSEKETYLRHIRERLEGHMSSTERVVQQMARYERHQYRSVSDRSFASGLDHELSNFVWHQGPFSGPGATVTALTFVVEVDDKGKAEILVRNAVDELKNVLPTADCWKYMTKQDLIDRRKGWAKQQRDAGNERMAKKQERDLETLLAGNHLDLARIQYQWAPEGYMDDPATASRKQRIQMIELIYNSEDVRVLIRDIRPEARD